MQSENPESCTIDPEVTDDDLETIEPGIAVTLIGVS